MCSHYLYIYQASSQWQPFLISSYQFFGVYSHIISCFVSASLPPTPKQPVAVDVINILRTFALKLSIVTLVCAMFADTMDSFNVCETAARHDLHGAPDPPRCSGWWHCLSCDIVHRFWHLSMLGQPPTRIFFLPSAEKKTPLVACKIYIFLTFAY